MRSKTCDFECCKSVPFAEGLCLFHFRLIKQTPTHTFRHIGSPIDNYVHLLGRVTDGHIARLSGMSVGAVQLYRKRHNIKRDDDVRKRCPKAYSCNYEGALGILSDAIIAKAFCTSQSAVTQARRRRGIPAIASVDARYLRLNFPFDLTPEGVAQFLAEYNAP